MKGGIQSGFTIVETLLVLVTTTLLILSAYALISGKQGQTEFDQAVNEVQSQLQQIIANANDGYFPNAANINCTAGTAFPPLLSAGSPNQGNNLNCIFLGTALHFYKVPPTSDPKNTTYLAYTVAARQCQSAGDVSIINTCQPVDTVGHALPVLMAPGTTVAHYRGLITTDSVVTNQLLNGVTTNTVYINGVPGNTIGTFAILSDPSAAYSSGSTKYASGQQRLALYEVDPSSLNAADSAHAVDEFDNVNPPTSTGTLSVVQQVQICFTSGTTKGSALITIGGTAGQLSVSLLRKDTLNCA
jgi:hypothetical protein